MKRCLLSYLLPFMILTFVNAQTDKTNEINRIKKNRNYLTATGTSSSSVEDASLNAKALLQLEIEQWLKENTKEDIAGFISISKENVSVIETKRGSLFRSFVYVMKKDILPYYKDEEPITDAKLITNNEKTNEVELVAKDTIVITNEDTILFTPTSKEVEMLKVTSFDMLNKYIKEKNDLGEIVESGKYATMPKDKACHVFIYNRQGQIPACLRITETDTYNIKTGNKDTVQNYKDCGAIWFLFSNDNKEQ